MIFSTGVNSERMHVLHLIKKYSFSIVLYFALCEGSTSLLNSVDLTIIPGLIKDADCLTATFFRLILSIFILIIKII